jgi:Kdo2-lipid IVA lauroyltransferase/acyltransferase
MNGIMERRIVSVLGSALGAFFYYVFPIRKRIVVENLTLTFQGKTKKQINQLAFKNYQHYGKLFIEFFLFQREEASQKHVRFFHPEVLERALQQGRGVIVISAHLGNWELLARGIAQKFGGFHILARPVKSPFFQKVIDCFRSSQNLKTVSVKGSFYKITELLKKNSIIGFALDQHYSDRKKSVYVPFLGRPASTTVGPALIAHRTGATIVFGLAVRDREGITGVHFSPFKFSQQRH